MSSKLILETKGLVANDFELTITDLSTLENIDLSQYEVILKCKEALSEKKLSLADSYIRLLAKLTKFDNDELNKLQNQYRHDKIKIMFEDTKAKSIADYINILNDINIFFRAYSINSEKVLDYSKDFVCNLEEIRNSINIKELINRDIESLNFRLISLEEVKNLEKFLNSNKKIFENNTEIINLYKNRLDEIIKNTFRNKGNILEDIHYILKEFYSESFLLSSDYKDVLLECITNKVDKYEVLLEEVNKAYLVYRFNRCINLESKKNVLYSELVPKYLPLLEIYKESVVSKIDSEYKNTLHKKKFFKVLDKTIEEINKQKDNKAIPL